MFILNRERNRCVEIKEVSYKEEAENYFFLKINGETFEIFANSQKGLQVFQEIINEIDDNVKLYKIPYEFEVLI